MHNHKHCHHRMMYCEKCDVAYCEKCGKEWGRKHYYYPYRWWGQTSKPYDGTITISDSSNISSQHICTAE